MKTVAIIGGGFSGTMTAVNLSRLSEHPLKVMLINGRRPIARGTAYGTKRSEHLLNVVARNMSALPDRPTHFVDWLGSRFEYSDKAPEELREMFAPRRIYGDYLNGLLASVLNPVDTRCRVVVETFEDVATDVERSDEARFNISLESGECLHADQIVLATGNQPPGAFKSRGPLKFDPRYRSDPWDEWLSRLPPPGGTVVLLGTGLTMIDIVLTLDEIGWEGNIVAVSRKGRLPKSHFRGIAYDDYIPDDAQTLGLVGLRKLVQQHCEQLRQMSQNSAIAVDKLRPHTQQLWQSLSKEEKHEFLKEDASLWNVTRHRIAGSIHNRVTDSLDTGKLKVVAGTVVELVPGEKQIDVMLEGEGGVASTESGDLVINCTGPQLNFSGTDSSLFANLLKRRLVAPDEMDMGVCVDENFAIQSDEIAKDSMYAIGPILRGSLWETTAVPELRIQAMRVAESILEREISPVSDQSVIEYYI